MNFSTFVYDERQCNRNRDRENLGDLPMGVIRFICGFRESVIRRYLCAADRFGEPAEELGILACRLGRQDKFFTIGLLCFLCRAIAKIPRQRIAVGSKLRIEGLGCRNGLSVVQTAAGSGRVPALESVTGLDRRTCRGGRCGIRLARRGDAGLAVNGAAVAACVPSDGQADRRAAVVTLPVTVCVGVVCIFFAGIAASEAGFRALVLRIVRF